MPRPSCKASPSRNPGGDADPGRNGQQSRCNAGSRYRVPMCSRTSRKSNANISSLGSNENIAPSNTTTRGVVKFGSSDSMRRKDVATCIMCEGRGRKGFSACTWCSGRGMTSTDKDGALPSSYDSCVRGNQTCRHHLQASGSPGGLPHEGAHPTRSRPHIRDNHAGPPCGLERRSQAAESCSRAITSARVPCRTTIGGGCDLLSRRW